MDQITILRAPVFSTLCNAAFQLRRAVFVREQKVPEDIERDSYDLTAIHIVAVAEGEVVGTLRLIAMDEHIKIGRVAVDGQWRGKGIARKMITAAQDYCRTEGRDRFFLTAQSDKLVLYEKLGFVAFGPEFMEGGMPHRAMRDYDKDSAGLAD